RRGAKRRPMYKTQSRLEQARLHRPSLYENADAGQHPTTSSPDDLGPVVIAVIVVGGALVAVGAVVWGIWKIGEGIVRVAKRLSAQPASQAAIKPANDMPDVSAQQSASN